MLNKKYKIIDTSLGKIYLFAHEQNIIGIFFKSQKSLKFVEKCFEYDENYPVLIETENQIQEYLRGLRQSFNLPFLFTIGTNFQHKVWSAAGQIKPGKTMSYSQLAIKIGIPKGYRAIANAIAKNPLLLVIPCHRIIGHNGSLTGYSAGIEIKKQLLELEANFN